MDNPSTQEKSAVLWVARTISSWRAVAAINASPIEKMLLSTKIIFRALVRASPDEGSAANQPDGRYPQKAAFLPAFAAIF